MRLPPSSDSSIKDTLIGIEITLFGFIFVQRSYMLDYSAIVGDIIIFLGIWVAVSGYYSDKGTDAE